MRAVRSRLLPRLRHIAPMLLIGLLSSPGSPATAQDDASSYVSEIESWRQRRLASLTSDDGWLTLVGLTWLEQGESRLGSGTGSQVVFPTGKAPELVGSIFVAGTEARIEVAPGVEVLHEGRPVESMALATDAGGSPTVLELGAISFYLIDRDGRLAVRMKDPGNPAREAFAGIETWPVDPSWRHEARLETHDPPRTVPIPTVLGTVSPSASPGTVVFERDGEELRIDALEAADDNELFLVFADGTTGRESYGGGRYLYAEVDSHGVVDLDFNKAYNPPCAFTAFATCPLPPRQNRLPIRIEAGEMAYHGDH